jgi:hypothetical protein
MIETITVNNLSVEFSGTYEANVFGMKFRTILLK